MAEQIHRKLIQEEIKDAYIDYAMSVIVGRALPDVYDGLKPVHRRILFAMKGLGMVHNKPYKKSARIVGTVLGMYHPHGDAAVYESIVRMAQDFSLRYPLVDGQGNWGCFTGNTKVKLTDGRSLTFKDLIKEAKKGKRHWTYTFNAETKKIETAEIKKPRLTRRNEEIVEIELGNRKKIQCTHDHLFMLKSGNYKKAKDLKENDPLMCLHTNHKVVSVEFLKKREDVYDLTIDPWHNFALDAGIFVHNSIDGDNAASMRYTECRMSKVAEEMLADLDKETVDFIPNFDGSLEEPVVLPAKLPNLLVNGSSGIAVGMATNIPPHNLAEVSDAVLMLLERPECTVDELPIKGPDFPTGGIIYGTAGVRSAYAHGRGKIRVRARTEIEGNKLVVSEIPYMVNKSSLIEETARLVHDKVIEGITDIRDESDREGMRIVLTLKKDINHEVVLNQLFKHTQLQTTFGIIMLALHGNQPKVMGLKEILEHYISHRKSIIRRRTQFDLTRSEERAHILEGLRVALVNIDPVVKTVKNSKSPDEAKAALMESFKLSEKQSQAILDMKLQRLTGLEQEKINVEYDGLLKLIIDLKDILGSEKRVVNIIKSEVEDLKKTYGDKRRTEIEDVAAEIVEEDLIPEEDVVVIGTRGGYVKKLLFSAYHQQNRGGKGVKGMKTQEEDIVEHLFTASTHSYILAFSNLGRVYWLKAYSIPTTSRYAKGKAIVNLLKLRDNEKINAMIPIREFNGGHYLIMATKKGLVKKTSIDSYSNPRKGGIIGMGLRPGDEVVQVRLTPGKLRFIIATRNGMAVKFNESDVRPTGRGSTGVRGITLVGDDEVVGMEVALESGTLMSITENGFGKRSLVSDYRMTRRGGKGVINIQTSDRNGKVVGVKTVRDHDELLFISSRGVVIRVPASQINVIGRNTQGVRVMRMNDGDRVNSCTRVVSQV